MVVPQKGVYDSDFYCVYEYEIAVKRFSRKEREKILN